MKKLFTFMSLMAFTMAMNAQDPSKWEKGQDVSAEIGLKELGDDFSGERGPEESGRLTIKSIGNVWKGTAPNEFLPSAEGRPTVIGFYNMKEFEFYQIVKMPAGDYTLKANAFYREGTPADNFNNMWKDKKFMYGHMFANVMDDDQTNVTFTNDLIIKSIAESGYHEAECLHYDSEGSWMNDYKDIHLVDGTSLVTWAPSCCLGFAKFFAAGCYLNENRFILTQDAYVKIGFSKTGSISQDCLDFSNIQVIYNGPADDASLRSLAIEEYEEAASQMGNLVDVFENAGCGALADILYNLKEKLDAQIEESSIEQIGELKEQCINYCELYKKAKDVVFQLNDIIDICNLLLNTTEYPGFDEFKAAVEAQRAAVDEKDAEKIGDPTPYYNNIVQILSSAHAKYLDSQVIEEDKPKDFTTLIKNPWFVNTEFTPVNEGDADGQYWHLTEESWAGMPWDNEHQNVGSYKDKLTSFSLTDITSKVDISIDKSVSGQWFKYQDHTDGYTGGTQLWYSGRLVGFSTGWAATFWNKDGRPGIEGIAQRLVGLPNGYYTVSCLVRGWDATNNWGEHAQVLGCFAENSQEVRVSSKVSENINNWWEWQSRPDTWDNVETQVIFINDGKLLIGGGGSIANTVTGFRLWFYGEQPNFAKIAREKREELRSLIDESLFAGDKKKLNDLLNSVVDPVSTPEAFDAANLVFNEFDSYLSAATKKLKEFTAVKTINDIPVEWTNPFAKYLSSFADGEDATYDKIDGLNALANAYQQLNDVYTKIGEAKYDVRDAQLKSNMKAQQTALCQAIATQAEVEAYINTMEGQYKLNLMKDLKCDEATAEKPVSISTLINNPTFDEQNPEEGEPSINKSGWTCAEELGTNVYARGNVELWDKNPFTLSQKISNLPGGTYKLRVKAIYRDSESVTAELKEAFEKAGGEENWAHHNAVLFAKTSDENNQTAYIKSIYRINQTSLSFTEVATSRPFVEGMPTIKTVEIVGEPKERLQDVDYYTMDGEKHDKTPYGPNVYPFDFQIGDNFYPGSMYGFYMACQQHPEAITSEVTITIEDGETLEIGIKKDTKIEKDWVIFDDFELEYVSGEAFARAFTGVENIVVDAKENGAIFNMAGQRVGKDFKGIVIKNGVKVLNK